MNFHSFVFVLMAGIMVIGGGILIAMLVLESPRWWALRSWLGYASTSIRRLRRAGPSDPGHDKKAHRRMVASPAKPPAAP
jgi:hypothetical protein